jgi:VWFA-related protein
VERSLLKNRFSIHSSGLKKSVATVAFAILSVPVSCVLLLGQTDSTKAVPTDSDVVNVNEVSLDLMVRDKKGKPVLDLKPTDIAVTDGGTPVKIASLRLVTGEHSTDHRLTLVFDRLDLAASHNARDIAMKILKLVPPDEFSFSVLKTEGRLMLYQDFTPDRAALTHAISSATDFDEAGKGDGASLPEKRLIAVAKTGADETGTAATAKERSTAQVLLAALQESQRILQDQHTQPSLSGVLALARTERKLAGRKTIIYFTQGLHVDASTGEMLHEIIESANRSDVGIYAIDSNALTAQADQSLVAMMAMGNARAAAAQAPAAPISIGSGPGAQTVAQPPPGLAPMVSTQYMAYETGNPNDHKNPLAEFAERTGGAYLGPDENLKKHIHQMMEDMTSDYEAYYAPPVENFDGQFRAVAVKSVRDGLKVRSRAGYFALPPDSGTTVRPFEAPLMKLLSDAQLPSDIKFRSRVLRLGDLAAGNENTMVVEVPVSELETRDDPNTNLYSLRVSMVAQIKSKSGAVIEHFSEDIPRHGALDAKASAQSDVMTMQRNFAAPPGEYVMEAAILDRVSGKTAAQRIEFEVPNEPSGPSLSDVTMVQRLIPSPQDVDSDEPLRYGNGKVIPDLSGRVAHGKKEISFFFLVHPDPSVAEQPTLEMEVLKSGEPIAQVPLQLRKTNGPATIPYLASIQSASLPSGDYQVIEKLTQGGKTAERDLTFRVEGPELANAAKPENAADANPSAMDGEAVTASDVEPPDSDANKNHRLVITSLPAGTVPPPSAEQLQAIVASARKRALDYSKSLPNFICVEVTNRSVDASGNGRWKRRDSIAEMLRYHNNQETRTTLEINGQRSSLQRTDMNSSWPLSVGEFGAMLNLVFQPSSKTDFEWKEAAAREDRTGTVQVLSYRVKRENATITLGQGNDQVGVGFHGLVYVDAATGGVQRITLQADDLPRNFSMSAASMTVDYDYTAIADRDYLLPVRSTVSLQRHHKEIELNEIAFRSYRRFASRSKIKLLQ